MSDTFTPGFALFHASSGGTPDIPRQSAVGTARKTGTSTIFAVNGGGSAGKVKRIQSSQANLLDSALSLERPPHHSPQPTPGLRGPGNFQRRMTRQSEV